jgi:predicted ATPase
MKLETIEIRDFRGIEKVFLSFKDELDLIRDRVPIIGPNTSGKTTLLDAIALCLMPVTELYQLRAGLRLTPSSLVRQGARSASVTCTVWFADDEIEATREVLERAGNPYNRPLPRDNRVQVHWKFPDPQGRSRSGCYRCEPSDGWMLFRGRKVLTNNLHVPGLSSRGFRRLGSVVLFDQERTGLGKQITSYEQAFLGRLLDPDLSGGVEEADRDDPGRIGGRRTDGFAPVAYTTDPLVILTSLAMRAQVAQDREATEQENFAQLRELYQRVCHPHRIGGLYNTDHGLDMEFIGERGVCYYDGLSSGQQMVLLLLLQFATRRIHRSIVLLDELELHLHPLWQDRLYEALTDLGDDNQILFTTHSTHLRDTIREPFYHCTGELEDATAAK